MIYGLIYINFNQNTKKMFFYFVISTDYCIFATKYEQQHTEYQME